MATVETVGTVNSDMFEMRKGENNVNALWMHVTVPKGIEVYDLEAILPAVYERIESGKMPAGVLSKSLARIVHHSEQLSGALSDLLSTYQRMVTGKRASTSVAYKARYALLDGMPNKLLKAYAEEYIPDEVGEYILTDASERIAMIQRLCAVLVDEGKGEDTEQGEQAE